MILTHMTMVINESALDRLVGFRDTKKEAPAGSKTAHGIVTTADAHLVTIAYETDFHVGAKNIHVLTHPYATCHALDVEAHSMHSQIANLHAHLNRSRQA